MVVTGSGQKTNHNGLHGGDDVKSTGQQTMEVLELIGEILILFVKMFYAMGESLLRLFMPPQETPVKGEIVLITGTGHGIGKELALKYASEGATVVCLDVNQTNNNNTVQEIASLGYAKAHGYQCDVSDRENVAQVAKRVQEEVGDVSILINNAGIMPTHALLDHTAEEIERIFKINVLAHFWTINAFLPTMIKNNQGHIVCLSSCAGLVGFTNLVPYCASKFAVRGLMEALHEELRETHRSNIKLTVIYPYMVDTGLCKRPRIRFSKAMPLLDPKSVAGTIMDAQKRGLAEITLPGYIFNTHNIVRTLPRKCAVYLKNFFNTGLESDLK